MAPNFLAVHTHTHTHTLALAWKAWRQVNARAWCVGVGSVGVWVMSWAGVCDTRPVWHTSYIMDVSTLTRTVLACTVFGGRMKHDGELSLLLRRANCVGISGHV